jgi:hypothetical protein
MSEPTLIELLHGKGAHANPVACVEDLSPRSRRPHDRRIPTLRLADSQPHELLDAVAHFRDLIDTLIRHAQSDSAALSREVPAAHTQQTGYSSTVRAILWQTMAHNTYHIGQIAMLRRCLGVWPPRAGGDTW